MTPYLILSWCAGDSEAEARTDRLRLLIGTQRPRWQCVIDQPGALVVIPADRRAITIGTQDGPIILIGDIFSKEHNPLTVTSVGAGERSFAALCSDLVVNHWGAYLAVQVRRGGDIAIFRDPIGMRDGVHWVGDGVRVFASEIMPWITVCMPQSLSIDWRRVAALLRDSATISEATPLAGIETIPAGSLLYIHNSRIRVQRLWRPRMFYRRGTQPCGNASGLQEVVAKCVSTWVRTYPCNILEMSGGFDSSVVASAAPTGGTRIAHAINFFTDHLSGDERRYARDVSAQCGIPLDEIFMPVGSISEANLEGVPIGARPGLTSTTLFHDRPLTRIAADHGATALFTGHGGDSVFFQHPTAMIAADPSFPRTTLKAYTTLAKWSRESVWTVAGYVAGMPLVRSTRPFEEQALVALPLAHGGAAQSLWADDLRGLPPAKRVQITAIATDRSAIGPSCRSAALTVLHPLLSQPLVEWAIAADTYVLTAGRRDRALARQAFAPRLPQSVTDRRGKGVLAQYFGRCLCASVPFLRAYLLDGLLVQNKVLDAVRLEAMLDRDFLMRFDCYAKLRSAIIMEHWARGWQARMGDAH